MLSCFPSVSCLVQTLAFLPEMLNLQMSYLDTLQLRIINSLNVTPPSPETQSMNSREQYVLILLPITLHTKLTTQTLTLEIRTYLDCDIHPHSQSLFNRLPVPRLLILPTSPYPHCQQYPSMGDQGSSISTRTIRRMGEDQVQAQWQ
jgi:hypothetical protein